MFHLLVDVDSKIPNLALMRISAWLKKNGHEVRLLRYEREKSSRYQSPSRVWISCIFTWNRATARGIAAWWESAGVPVEIGGSGFSLLTKLPNEIESEAPDYSLYGDDRAIGFVQRGCIRSCEFCIVPLKEGQLKANRYNPLTEWVPDGFSKILLLDNEFAACPHENEVLSQCKENDWKLSITQGYDLRCVTADKASALVDCKPWNLKFTQRTLYAAWDYIGIEPYVRQGIQGLLNAGFQPEEITVFCLAGMMTDHFQDYYRFHVLWNEYGVLPFIMKYNKRQDDKWLNKFARFVNRGPVIYRKHGFEEYEGLTDLEREETIQIVGRIRNGEHASPIPHRTQPTMKEVAR